MVSPKLMLAWTSCQFQFGMDWAFPDHLVLFGKKKNEHQKGFFRTLINSSVAKNNLMHVLPSVCTAASQGRDVMYKQAIDAFMHFCTLAWGWPVIHFLFGIPVFIPLFRTCITSCIMRTVQKHNQISPKETKITQQSWTHGIQWTWSPAWFTDNFRRLFPGRDSIRVFESTGHKPTSVPTPDSLDWTWTSVGGADPNLPRQSEGSVAFQARKTLANSKWRACCWSRPFQFKVEGMRE